MEQRRDRPGSAFAVREAPRDVLRQSEPPPIGRHSTIRPTSRTISDVGIPRQSTPPSGSTRPSQLPLSPTSPRAEAERLVQHLRGCAPGAEERVAPTLLALGEHALDALARAFPGPLWVADERHSGERPKPREISAIASALLSFGDEAAPFLSWLLASPDPEVRYYAAVAAEAVPSAELLRALGHVLLDSDADSRRVALGTVRRLRPLAAFVDVLATLRERASSRSTRGVWRVRAVEALADLRDSSAVPDLVELLGTPDRSLARASHRALLSITAHDLGSLRQPWKRWMRSQGQRHRIEWLIDGLADQRSSLRELAAEELRREAGEPLTLPADASLADYLEVQRTYQAWWARLRRL